MPMPQTVAASRLSRLTTDERTGKLLELLRRGKRASSGGLWGSSASLLLSSLTASGLRFLVVTPSAEMADDFADDISLFLDEPADLFPSWEVLPHPEAEPDLQIFSTRFSLLSKLRRAGGDAPLPAVTVAPIQALLQPVPSPTRFAETLFLLKPGLELDPGRLKTWLVDAEFERVDEVELPGHFSSRGCIVDLFPNGHELPLRVEFFGDRIDSIRRFDPSTQRSLAELPQAEVVNLARSEFFLGGRAPVSLAEYLPPDTHAVLLEPGDVEERAIRYSALAQDPSLIPYPRIFQKLVARGLLEIHTLPVERRTNSVNFNVRSVQAFSSELAGNLAALGRLVDEGLQVLVVCSNDASKKRFDEILSDSGNPSLSRVRKITGRLSSGFRFDDLGIAITSDREVFSRYRERRERKHLKHARPLDSFLELKPGDYVVHLVHGIGRFVGLQKLHKDFSSQECLVVQYRDKARLYVPVSRIDLVQRYVGLAGARPTIDKLGGVSWSRRKAAAASAVGNLAKDLLFLQALRDRSPGIAYPPDSDWHREFEASFVYEETEDQLSIAHQIKDDMELQKPMDRLVCGDVGYGKTELAMRAAFKAVSFGKQVAVLVPTTVLAQQHYKTFTERMAEYPVEIEVLSRFRTEREQQDIIQRTKKGRVDILIGTHRLIQNDVSFKDLGLVIIDEEQRFGVIHKEKLKRLRETVDVLTMTATPIPRTLHMSLLGIKDISALETPPRDRLAIDTRVLRFDAKQVREAILRELNRDGQVFFVHNRVYNIHTVATRIQQILPEAIIAIAHGQMHERELEDVMTEFLEGRIDVLVTTTIIESGLDIPNSNTIFINDADMFGLADLHQLRGRVGRYKHHAYAYLLLPEHRPVTPAARKRLRAIEELSQLGAGFEIALRDLEIRGAGNILGAEQSGHIAAVGHDLYGRLLDKAVRRTKGLPPLEDVEVVIRIGLDEYIPDQFIPSLATRMNIYRKLCRCRTHDEVQALAEELTDRFGPPPKPVLNMIALADLRVACRNLGILSVRTDDSFLILSSPAPRKLRNSLLPFDPRIVDEQTIYLPLPQAPQPAPVADHLKKVLKHASQADNISVA